MELVYMRYVRGTYDSGYLHHYEADFDISTDLENSTNDFELTTPLPKKADDLLWLEGSITSFIFIEGTEYGGEILGSKIDLERSTVTYTGRTWRGTLEQFIIEPPAGQDYRVVSGNLATILNGLPCFPFMVYDETDYSINSFTFDRYITVYEGATKLLAACDSSLRLAFSFEQTANQYTGIVRASIVQARDLTEWIEVSQDYSDHVRLTITKDHTTPRHLICLGQGELKNREVVHLYADDEWTITTTPIPGAYPVETYDYSSSTNLLADGLAKYTEIIGNHEQIDVDISDLDVRLGDVIAAKDNLTGETATAEITKIVYKCEDYGTYQKETYEYQTKVRL